MRFLDDTKGRRWVLLGLLIGFLTVLSTAKRMKLLTYRTPTVALRKQEDPVPIRVDTARATERSTFLASIQKVSKLVVNQDKTNNRDTLLCPKSYNAAYAGDPQKGSGQLLTLARQYRRTYLKGFPYKHIIFDDFVPDILLKSALKEIMSSYNKPAARWKRKLSRTSIKSSTYLPQNQYRIIGEHTARLFKYLNSKPFIAFLEELTGINNIVEDELVNGAGVSKIDHGGFLSIHADFNQEPAQSTPGWRRLNVLIYLNENWEERDGASLELWRTNMSHGFFEYVAKVLPVFNRAVIFSTTDVSMHGHLDLVTENKSRLAISTYYYTKKREDELISKRIHSTIYPKRFFQTQSYERWKEEKARCPLV